MRLTLKDSGGNSITWIASVNDILGLAKVANSHSSGEEIDLSLTKDTTCEVDNVFCTVADYIESAKKEKN